MNNSTRNVHSDDRYRTSASRAGSTRSRSAATVRSSAVPRSGARASSKEVPRASSAYRRQEPLRSVPSPRNASRRDQPHARRSSSYDPQSRRPSAPRNSAYDGRVSRPSQPAPRAYRNPPPRRPKKHSRSAQRRRARFTAFVVLAVLLLIGGRYLYVLHRIGYFDPTYVENIYINGVSYAGVSKEEGVALARTAEEEWLNEPFTFLYLNDSWTFTRASVDAKREYETQLELAWNLGHIGSISERKQQVDALARNPVYLESKITYDETKLDAFIDQICAAIDCDAVDAVVVTDVNQPLVVSESQTGLKVDRDQLHEQLVTLIETGESNTAIPVETLFPTVSSDLLSYQVIAEVQTDTTFRNSSSRHNVSLALSFFNAMVVQPGETCDFNEIVGKRTKERGFKKATEYAGDRTTEGIGGGVCQASTTLYQALTEAGLTVLERHQHSMTVSYAEPSRDAAVSDDGKNLIFQNNTVYPIYIYTSVTSEWATVTIYGHQPEYRYELESVIIESGIQSTRKVTVEDTSGTHVYYKDDPPVVCSVGKDGCTSEGWLVAYDWETGEEVSRVCIDRDYYQPGSTTYWVGVHERMTAIDPIDGIPAY